MNDIKNSELESMINDFTQKKDERIILKKRFIESKTFTEILGYTSTYPYREKEIELCKKFGEYVMNVR